MHLIVNRLIPQYLDRLPDARDCRAIRELLTWQDEQGESRSLTTRIGLLITGYMGWPLRDFRAFVRSRLFVDTVGVHLDCTGSATYRWAEIRGFDAIGPHEFMDLPSAGAVMRLCDGGHISLERLDHAGGDFRNSARAIAEITARVATLNRRLHDARRTADR